MNKARLQTFGHLLAGFVILLHGWTAYELGHKSSWLFMLMGVLFMLIAAYHKRLSKQFPRIDGIMFLIESMALAATSYDYFHEHKTYLQWVILAASIIYLALGFSVLSGIRKAKHAH